MSVIPVVIMPTKCLCLPSGSVRRGLRSTVEVTPGARAAYQGTHTPYRQPGAGKDDRHFQCRADDRRIVSRRGRRGCPAYVLWLDALGRGDVARVGGKNASLGELVRNLDALAIKVPPGFATTADAYWRFIAENGLGPVIAAKLAALKAAQGDHKRDGRRHQSGHIGGRLAGRRRPRHH